jgi:hypothetical protein
MIMLRPIYFYAKLKVEDWKTNALSFLLMTSWLLAFAASIAVFFVQYLPIGATLLEKVAPHRTIFIVPVMIVLAAVFFLITLFIMAGFFVCALMVGFWLVAYLLHLVFSKLGGKGELNQMLQYIYYSSAAVLIAAAIFMLMVLVKYAGMDFTIFRFGYNTIYCLLVLYIYGLWAVAGRKVYGVSKAKAFTGALVPVIALLIFGFLFDKIALSHLQPWIG